MENKELLLAAIDSYDLYSANQIKVLKALVSTAVDSVANISAYYISGVTGLSVPTIYLILRNLENEQVIKKFRSEGSKRDAYELNNQKLNNLVQLYNNKKSLLNDSL